MMPIAPLFFALMSAQADSVIPPDAEKQKQVMLTLDDAGFEAQFQCPDTLPNPDRDEIWKIGLFLYWAKNRHPEWSFDQAVEFRHQLFIKHRCAPWPPHQ